MARPLREAIQLGHPWIYRQALQAPPDFPSGTVVDISDREGFVARGLYDKLSPIAVRVYSLDKDQLLDGALVASRLAAAYEVRRRTIVGIGQDTTGYRLCHGEGDRLPGIVVDIYGPIAVVITDGEAARTLLPDVVSALAKMAHKLSISTIYERQQRRNGHGGGLLYGEPPQLPASERGRHPYELVFREHGMRLLVDVENGQKTGMFLDQRENRRLIRDISAGLSVWNGFSYTGGFSLAAALGGATRVVSVDRAEAAIDTARRNFALAGLPLADHEFLAEDAFAALARSKTRGEHFDLVIVDPPSFAPTQQAVPGALSAYRRLHEQAIDLVTQGGLLAAASCSSHIDEKAFLSTICDAAVAKKRAVQLLEIRSQPSDHPTLPAFPEGRYLKFILCRVS
ncbi:MAG TPA: class I SAM-dependent rRNA methyltransferase [Pseudomonadota bacterium]|nr:class I SAM-dependent rRNA methyltransferase [Pseudomonadota bacterium]